MTLMGSSQPSLVRIDTRASSTTSLGSADVSFIGHRVWQNSVRKMSKQMLPTASAASNPDSSAARLKAVMIRLLSTVNTPSLMLWKISSLTSCIPFNPFPFRRGDVETAHPATSSTLCQAFSGSPSLSLINAAAPFS